MKHLLLILYFYKNYVLVSLFIQLILHLISFPLPAILLTKVFLFGAIFFTSIKIGNHNKFAFHQNLSLSITKLFLGVLGIDLLISVLIANLTTLFF